MDLHSQKLEFIQWFIGITNPKVIQKVLTLKKNNEEDWWDIISEEEKQGILKGIEQAKTGKTIKNSQIFEKYKKWITK